MTGFWRPTGGGRSTHSCGRKPVAPSWIIRLASRVADRPNHPDFWRLSEVGLKHDGEALEGGGPGVVVAELVDEPSLMYLIKHRLGQAFGERMGQFPRQDQFMIMAIYMDAFTLGVEFEKAGGHQSA